MIEKRVNELKVQKFLKEAEQDMSVKSFIDKHFITITPTLLATYVLSFVSVIFGCIAIYTTALQTVGLNIGILESFEQGGYLPYLLLIISMVLLSFFEVGKHHFYKQGFLEYYRETDDFGGREFRFAVLLQIVSIGLSFYGGYLAANELAGTQKTQVLAAIQSEYEPLIAKAKQDKQEYKDAKTWRGKIADKHTPELNRLQGVVNDLESQYKLAKDEAGVSNGFVAATEIGTAKMIFILGGSQIVIEVFLTFALWWLIYIKSRAVFEYKNGQSKPPKNRKTNRTTPTPFLKDIELKTPVIAEQKPQRQIGFFKDEKHTKDTQKPQTHKHTNTNRHKATTDTNTGTKRHKTPVSVVPQQIQGKTHKKDTNEPQRHTVKIIDLGKEKKRVRSYIPRINKSYTESLLNRLTIDVKKLAKYGYKVNQIEGRISIKKELPNNSEVEVTYSNNKLKINYL
jgi:hypothetical protein